MAVVGGKPPIWWQTPEMIGGWATAEKYDKAS